LAIGILGGTFDPVHNGHLHIAESVLKKFGLKKILFIPTNIPPHKVRDNIVSNEHRLKMLQLAVSSYDFFEISTIEFKRGGRSYTLDTLNTLRRMYPQDECRIIFGADMVPDFHLWKEPEKVIEMGNPIITTRPGINLAGNLENVIDESLLSFSEKLKKSFIEIEPVDISSSLIREYVIKGHSINGMVPEMVEKYIFKNKLYSGF
jgi:nicotinate-nucleotide adenylyltransferase